MSILPVVTRFAIVYSHLEVDLGCRKYPNEVTYLKFSTARLCS